MRMICIACHRLPPGQLLGYGSRREVRSLGYRSPHGFGARDGRPLLGCGDSLVVAELLAFRFGCGERGFGAREIASRSCSATA